MGLIDRIFGAIFGGGRNVIVETAQVFRENAENAGVREAAVKQQAMQQYAAEFMVERRGWFDRLMDGLNRLPRPFLAFGNIGLFIVAMVDPVWFASRMQGIALVPDPLWWLMGAIVSFYFGARHQAHSQDFQRSIAQTMARVPTVVENTRQLEALQVDAPEPPAPASAQKAPAPADNAALVEWAQQKS
ncbi:holin family protein [Pseudooctadecabacter sp.]|uniref:holin family protein n=1 Tax=Pseudooctadecabacter sp. TaxID=1966338 RepID=UPI0035C7E452